MRMAFRNPRLILVVVGGWLLYGVFFASQSYLSGRFLGRKISFTETLIRWSICAGLWIVVTPIVYHLARKFPYEKGQVLRRLGIHLMAGAVLSIFVLTAFFVAWQIVKNGFGGPFDVGEWQRLLVSEFHVYTLLYFILIGIYYVYDYYHQFREHQRRVLQLEVAAAQLETQLAQAQLNALRMQIHPHFLFNTLNSISVLIMEDANAAKQMLLRLSELLRVSLRSGSNQVVALREELDFLRDYLAIEEARFRDRLRVNFRVEPETLDAEVPNLVLQPLVENAIRHGIANRSKAGGMIEIGAQRRDGSVELSVSDNGTGMEASEIKLGIGLTNTRERLERLYGENQVFRIRSNETGGVSVEIKIPFKKNE